jgi:hypothetical protein
MLLDRVLRDLDVARRRALAPGVNVSTRLVDLTGSDRWSRLAALAFVLLSVRK